MAKFLTGRHVWHRGHVPCFCVLLRTQVITGAQRASVASAVTRLEVLIDSFRRKQPFTHFLSFALNHPSIQEGFLKFKEKVLEQCSQVMGYSGPFFFYKAGGGL